MYHRIPLIRLIVFIIIITCQANETIAYSSTISTNNVVPLPTTLEATATSDDDNPDNTIRQPKQKGRWMVAGGSILLVVGTVGGVVLLGLGSTTIGACAIIGGIIGGTALIAGNNAIGNTPPEYSHHTQPPSYIPSHKDSTATATDTLSSTTLKEQPDNLLANPDPDRIAQYKGLYRNACSRAHREVSGFQQLATDISSKQKMSSSNEELVRMKKTLEEKRARLQNELNNLQYLRQQIYYYGGPSVPDPVEAKIQECLNQQIR